ncbi:hypothetical protein RchiOBHm_Chr2g0110371 [Rosa chinensis]|uniref:Uncharacterized protein n=1 Tax=Rosa chinensis TaxID=74649 RepID=A0A2P6RPP7_ROSCH|nr:hypothetical protein RchiOBHm_Chr2g0110371 [Rosa chinensis]
MFVFLWATQAGLVAFREMGLIGVKPNAVTVLMILHACSESRDLNSGSIHHRDVHDEIE